MNNNNNANTFAKLPALKRFSPTLHRLLKNLSNSGRGRKQLVAMAVDAVLAVGCLWAAYSIRLGESFYIFEKTGYLFLILPAAVLICFASFGIYRWVVRSSNGKLFRQLLKGTVTSALVLLVLSFLIQPEGGTPRSLAFIFGVLLFVACSGIRMAWKLSFDDGLEGEPIAIYGAGVAGQRLTLLLGAEHLYSPVVFIDDSPELVGTTMRGLPIISGESETLVDTLERLDVRKVVLAMPSVSTAEYHRKLQKMSLPDIQVLTMPSLSEMMDGSAKIEDIRDVSISDILGRTEVAPDKDLMGRRITAKTVLVTGGGGSIGSELCRQVMTLQPERLIALENCEANLYHLTEELLGQDKENPYALKPKFTPILGSVLDKRRVDKLMLEFDIDTVIHAAAYKHVPIVEAQPDQGVDVNVFGTKTVLDSAVEHGVSDFVLISTDKAVRPTNAMGASKRVAELVLQAKAASQSQTCISMVRFGNVLGSSGSVVPKFKRQILEGGPITLTHLDVTRYFMTIPEAAQLVLQASAIAEGGEVFVLDMGEPVRIEDLAKTMVRLFGKNLKEETGSEKDIDIVVQGLRPGEKLYEELFISESSQQTEVPKISSAKEYWLEQRVLDDELSKLRQFADVQDSKAIKTTLLKLAFLKEMDVKTAEIQKLPAANEAAMQKDVCGTENAESSGVTLSVVNRKSS